MVFIAVIAFGEALDATDTEIPLSLFSGQVPQPLQGVRHSRPLHVITALPAPAYVRLALQIETGETTMERMTTEHGELMRMHNRILNVFTSYFGLEA